MFSLKEDGGEKGCPRRRFDLLRSHDANRAFNPRNRVIDEIIDSERSYINYLRMLNDYFELPLRLNHMMPSDVHNIVFRNLQAILKLNEELYVHLSEMEIGKAFLEMAPFLKLYSDYARHHHHAVMILQEWCVKSLELREFIEAQEQKPNVGLKVNALMIMPVQRIPRYEMLLRELLRVTPPNVYRNEYESLSCALDAVVDVACHINEHIRLAEDAQHMSRIQDRLSGRESPRIIAPGRKFIKEGILSKVSRHDGSVHERVFFLFSDILIYAKSAVGSTPIVACENNSSISSSKLECCSILPLHHCSIERLFGVTRDANAVMFKIACKKKSLIIFIPNREEGEDWLNSLESSIRKVQKDRQTLRKESSAMKPMRATQFNKADALKRKIDEEACRSLFVQDSKSDNILSPKKTKSEKEGDVTDAVSSEKSNNGNRNRCRIL